MKIPAPERGLPIVDSEPEQSTHSNIIDSAVYPPGQWIQSHQKVSWSVANGNENRPHLTKSKPPPPSLVAMSQLTWMSTSLQSQNLDPNPDGGADQPVTVQWNGLCSACHSCHRLTKSSAVLFAKSGLPLPEKYLKIRSMLFSHWTSYRRTAN